MNSCAWLEWNGTLYWVVHQRSPHEPRSALTALVSGIWERFPGSAHFILRSRIFINYEPTELCRGTVVVCAKRMSRVSEVPRDLALRMRDADRAIELSVKSHPGHSNEIVQPHPTRFSLPESNRSIECWLISAEGRLLACARNSSGRNRTRHAEMNLLQLWWAREHMPLPKGGRLVSTLEPCPMCAGAIWESLGQRADFRVQFVEPDPGSLVRRSILKGSQLLEQCKNLEHPISL